MRGGGGGGLVAVRLLKLAQQLSLLHMGHHVTPSCSLVHQAFSALFSALFTFPADYRMLLKERASGM